MDSDEGKLFIGGISWETSEDRLKEYYGKYGEVLQVVIMRDKVTGRPRGFGFVVFADPSVLDQVLVDKHTIDGRTVEAKRALSREEQQHTSSRSTNVGRNAGGGGGGGIRTKKIFVGGLPPTLTEDEFRQYFQNYGDVTDVVVMYDQSTNRPRGFGFISFDTEDIVDKVLQNTFHELKGKKVEVKRALPKELNSNVGGTRSSGGSTYQTFGNPSVNAGPYDGRTDGSRYLQPQIPGSGHTSYGSSGYAASGYGYGAPNNGVGYGGGYGVSGYGGVAAGYNGPAGPYGTPNPSGAGYVGGPPGAPRSPWNSQAPSGYGSAGYGAGYGAAAAAGTWSAPAGTGGAVAAPTSQSPGYGNQGYGYGGYAGTGGSYGNQGGYGAVGGRGGGSNPAGPTGEQGLYMAEARIDSRHRKITERILSRVSVSEFLAIDTDHNGFIRSKMYTLPHNSWRITMRRNERLGGKVRGEADPSARVSREMTLKPLAEDLVFPSFLEAIVEAHS